MAQIWIGNCVCSCMLHYLFMPQHALKEAKSHLGEILSAFEFIDRPALDMVCISVLLLHFFFSLFICVDFILLYVHYYVSFYPSVDTWWRVFVVGNCYSLSSCIMERNLGHVWSSQTKIHSASCHRLKATFHYGYLWSELDANPVGHETVCIACHVGPYVGFHPFKQPWSLKPSRSSGKCPRICNFNHLQILLIVCQEYIAGTLTKQSY